MSIHSSVLAIGVVLISIGVMCTYGNPQAFHLTLLEVKPVEEWKPSELKSIKKELQAVLLPEIIRLPESQHRKVIMPVAFNDFDPTEVAVPWYVLTKAGHTVVFASPNGGERPTADMLVITGYLGGLIRAKPAARVCYSSPIPNYNISL